MKKTKDTKNLTQEKTRRRPDAMDVVAILCIVGVIVICIVRC